MLATTASNHAFGQNLIILSIVLSMVVMVLLGMINVKRDHGWSGIATMVAFVAIASEIAAAIYLW